METDHIEVQHHKEVAVILGTLAIDAMRWECIAKVVRPDTWTNVLDLDIKGLAYDSRMVKPGYLFVAIPGRRQDGAAFIEDALKRGAAAVVGELDEWPYRHVPYMRVADARRALAEISCAYFNDPSSRMDMYGITGTNGKTTISFMVRAILRTDGQRPGLIGTIQYEMGERVIPAHRTTPEAPDLQSMLEKMERAGCDSAVMEVSSHALDQKRVWGIDYDVAIFSNLTREHLDYHGTMEEYFKAKARLFACLGVMKKEAVGVVNADDPWGQRILMQSIRASMYSYGLKSDADVRAIDVRLEACGSSFTVESPWGRIDLRLPMLGAFNISNALAALTACAARGVALETIKQALETMDPVPGRLQLVAGGRKDAPRVLVDYAHTDDALANALSIVRETTAGKVIVVFGCGGDRDRSKRPAMGAVAHQFADHIWITSDNPRSEDPAAIAADIEAGLPEGALYTVCLDREQAILGALRSAQQGDTVLIAGKGHENYQEFNHTIAPFDDVAVARHGLQ